MALVLALYHRSLSFVQSAEQASDPTSIHPPLLVVGFVLTLQLVSMLFLLLMCVSFLFLPTFSSLLVLASDFLPPISPTTLLYSSIMPSTSSVSSFPQLVKSLS